MKRAGNPPTRRRLLAAGGAALAAAALPRAAFAEQQPAERAGELSPDGFHILRAAPGQARLRGPDAGATEVWGYGGGVPGPVLRVRRGEALKVRLVNGLAEPTAVHWHGLRIPNAMDGAAPLTQPPVAPGASFDYGFSPPDAGTFWYHAHVSSSQQVGRGLYGALVVEETAPVDVDRDVLLVLADWRLTCDGAVARFGGMHDAAHQGRIGNHLTVNGAPSQDIAVSANERLRLRLVNAANARIMTLRLERHDPVVMAIDGQPAEPFAPREGRLVLGPGNRIDVFADLTLAPGETASLVAETDAGAVKLARLVYAKEPGRSAVRKELKPLPDNPLPLKMDFKSALKLDIPLEGGAMAMMGGMGGMGGPRGPMGATRGADIGGGVWTLLGQASSGHSDKPMFSVKRGRTVMLGFVNRTAFPHAMHVHGHHFRLLDRLDDGWKPFWLDTLVVPPMATARIAFVADNPGKWMLHCHMLEHQEAGMAAWFQVG